MWQAHLPELEVWNELADEQVGATVPGENFIPRITSIDHTFPRSRIYEDRLLQN